MACQAAHPENADVTCDKSPHPFGAHMNKATGTSWPGKKPPAPVTSKKGSALSEARSKIEESGSRRRVGPPNTTALRNEILDRTWAKVEGDSKEMLRSAIVALAKTGELFTADDVTARMPEGWRPAHSNAVGAAFGAASKAGIIAKTGFVAAQGEKSHGRIVHQWVGVAGAGEDM